MGPKPSASLQYGLKRPFDILFSLFVLAVASPVMAVIAIAIRCTSGGTILFRQTRVGLNGRLFTIYKFRSMHASANPYDVTPESDDTDRRVTRVGRWLRKSGLDELPQFVNVLKGDMSVVGPRPEMPFLVEAYTPRQLRRLSIKPGITGPWQISEARREPIHENMQYDLYYLRYQSFLLDLKLIVRTFLIMFRPRTTQAPVAPAIPHEVRQRLAVATVAAQGEPQIVDVTPVEIK